MGELFDGPGPDGERPRSRTFDVVAAASTLARWRDAPSGPAADAGTMERTQADNATDAPVRAGTTRTA